MRKIYLLCVLIALTTLSYSQNTPPDTSEYPYWIDMMQDPKANFFETQSAFEKYWEGRARDKGDGWKPFKRWEWFTGLRVDEDGNKPDPGHVYNEYVKYFGSREKSGQMTDKKHWKEIGPVLMPNNGTGQPNGLGRVNCFDFHPTNASIIYAGAPSGGLWRTTNHGQSWTVLTDTLPTLGVSSIVVDDQNPSIIYLGTGDRDGSDAPGLGVWKSTDAGTTWNPSNTGMGNRVVGKMLMNPQDRNTLIAATNGGIYKSTNAGQNWTRKSGNTNNYKDLAFKPGDTSIVYAVAGGVFYRSTDGGENWTQITNGLPGANRTVIGVSPANANYVYLVHCNQRTFKGLYRSTNSGASFSLRSNSPNIMDYSDDGSGTSGQAWYDLCVVVDPSNINTLYVGGVNIFKSTNGGSTWTINAHWTGTNAPDIHADQHVLTYNPINSRIFSGNDGGVYYTSNGGSSWNNISDGLAIAQVYKIGQAVGSQDLVINGYQDNGTSIYNGAWRTEIGGDGMECIIDPVDTAYMYGALYYGDIRRSSNGGNWFSKIANSVTETGEWVTPYILLEGDPNAMIAGYKNVWKSTNVKANSTSAINWTQVSNNLGSTNSKGIRVLENSPADNDILYIAREDGYLFRSDNIKSTSPSYTDLRSGLPTSTWPKDIEAHPFNPNKVYIVQSQNVYESSNKGQSWNNISGTLPNVSINCIVYDSSSAGDLYIGTDLGVFFRGSWMNDWKPFSGGLPFSIEVTELEIYYDQNPDESRIKAATYGRGLWSSPLYDRPDVDFTASEEQLCTGQTVQFTNLTEGTYTDVLWLFEGGDPDSSTVNNPTVTYNQTGTFDVELQVESMFEQASEVKKDYISVDSVPVITINPTSATIKKGTSITLTASGATTYSWSPAAGLNKTQGPVVVATPLEDITYTVTGTNSFCTTWGGVAEVHITVDPIGLEERVFEGGSIRVFPNPASGKLKISMKNIQSKKIITRLLDPTGRTVNHKTFSAPNPSGIFELDLHDVPNGVYLLQIQGDTDQSTITLVIDHSI